MSDHQNHEKRIAIGSDHVGYPLKEELKAYLDELGYACQDYGTYATERTDYPLFAEQVTAAITSKQAEAGILICGTGVGMSITANKVRGIRAVVCTEPYSALLSRRHNDTNVLALGSRVVGPELAKLIVKSWLEAGFEGGRHASRLEIIARIESERARGAEQPDQELLQARAKIAETGKLVFERHLTDAAGGNISMRVGDRVCITPRYSGSKRHWQLQPGQVLVSDLNGLKLEGDGEISREAKVHYRLYQQFPHATAVLHSHARNVMAFVAAGQAIEPILEATLKFGTIPVVRFAPAHSERLAEEIAAGFEGRDDEVRKYAAAVIAPWHGLFVVGRDLEAAFDLTERIDTNAYCILMSAALTGNGPADPQALQLMLAQAIKSFNDNQPHA